MADPFAAVLAPPPGESTEEKTMRIAREAEATRVSKSIDDELRAEAARRKKRRVVNLLLLGQSESGKSTTLRQFQRLYTPSAFREERVLWRSVIQLNIIRSIRLILDTLAITQAELEQELLDQDEEVDERIFLPEHVHVLTQTISEPLRPIERTLLAKLLPPSQEHAGEYYDRLTGQRRDCEIFVRPGANAKGSVVKGKMRPIAPGRPWSAGTLGQETKDDAQEVLCSLQDDMIDLWEDLTVQDVLRKRRVRLEDSPGFFLNELARVTSREYFPTDEDVVRARLKTVGVSEHRFGLEVSAGRDAGSEWRIIDVGGSRSQRPTWIPFFDAVDAIIFLAPISAFDQVLAEDRSVNRLEDSVLLWKEICSNKLLAKVELILFLNKTDILDAKLKSGVRLSKYIRSFGDRPNDVDTVSKYMRGKFSAIQREYSPQPRKFYGFTTSVTDITTTAGILASVRDMVVREHLKQTRLI